MQCQLCCWQILDLLADPKMASAAAEVEIRGTDSSRLCLIRDVVETLYRVKIVENNPATRSDVCKGNAGAELSRTAANHDDTKKKEVTDKQKLAGVRQCPETQQTSSPVTLRFEGDDSVEMIEKAKNFAIIHLLPSADYTICRHQLENQLEFNMVLESSQDIQATTSAILTFDPESLGVTLQGPLNNVTSARSKIVMILDQLREQARKDSDIDTNDDVFYKNILDNFVAMHINDDSRNISRMLQNKPESTEITDSRFKPKGQRNSPSNENVNGKAFRNKNNSDWQENSEDFDFDAAQSPVQRDLVSPQFYNSNSEQLKKILQVSSDDDSSGEENILTDSRYSKKVEQALKLGYSEKQVNKVLIKLGPECSENDLLSELIKLGASDSDQSSVQIESDSVFSDHVAVQGQTRRQRFSACKFESADSSSFSDSLDSRAKSFVEPSDRSNLRDVIIDGSNVAMSHGKKVFSCKGIQIAVDWFRERGHKNITAFIPQWRKETSRPDAPITDQEILTELEKEGVVVFTPARRVKGRRVVCYDDRYILKLAVETDGIVVSNDVYRDLVSEREEFRKVVDQRLLMYTFVNDRFMPPEDPLGRLGPTLDNFLRKVPAEPTPKPQDCPYGKKCTYGNKCRFYHPERGFAPQKLITETLKEQADLKLQERANRLSEIAEKGKRSKQKLSRTKSLIPWDPSSSTVTSQTSGGGSKIKQEKPKLVHSKSVMLPTKSSDYLNEHRRKLEEAESTAAMEKISAQGALSPQQNTPAHIFSSCDSDNVSKVKSPSPRSSPTIEKDPIGDSPPKTCFSMKSLTMIHSRASPSHLSVPKPDPSEGYLSGHLYLAKKLSDESVESSFFSEHTCSPSSTRTTSPVVPLNKITNNSAELASRNNQEDITGPFTFPPPVHPSFLHQQQDVGDHDNIPHLSIFEHSLPQHSWNSSTSVLRRVNVDSVHFNDNMLQKINPNSPDSGLYASSESILSPYQNQPEQPLQFPSRQNMLYGEDSVFYYPEHPSLRRAFSSTGNFKSGGDLHPKLSRRASGFAASHAVEEDIMRPQNTSVFEKLEPYQFRHSYGLNRQNSSSDPQMHMSVAAGNQDMLPQIFSPGDSRNLQDPFSSVYQQYHSQSQSEQHFQRQLHQRSAQSGNTQNYYNPHLSPYGTGQVPSFPITTGNTHMMSSSPFSCNSPNVSYHHQPPTAYTPQCYPAPVSKHSTSRRQSVPVHPSYSQPHTASGYPTFPSGHHCSVSGTHHVSMPTILPEDAPINPDDSRYTIYYHLSNVFGEPVVRKVMNLNPNERNPDYVCKLIIQYKEVTGQ